MNDEEQKMWPYMMGGFFNGYGWVGSAFMVLFWVLLCLLIFAIAAGVVFLVQAFTDRGIRGGEKNTALDVLHERYARGEIGRDEYLERRRDLE
ncbi:SHOCT domain-containing protein [Acidithiobacillus sp.]|uniref:SHOCT domain-containing protein n=2 Tax=Acidithiobacillaceae TaxID=225058 RepID=UPI0025C120EB|nr:SHOCT domain-containing protein [Acidithiobacillus sp.]MCK9188103.1 SHOCT domain-containing protein [Acidithiobacillus sp.]MCK9360063.1 SHOCT domain-containing protein [Acidithiobacillus sp.]